MIGCRYLQQKIVVTQWVNWNRWAAEGVDRAPPVRCYGQFCTAPSPGTASTSLSAVESLTLMLHKLSVEICRHKERSYARKFDLQIQNLSLCPASPGSWPRKHSFCGCKARFVSCRPYGGDARTQVVRSDYIRKATLSNCGCRPTPFIAASVFMASAHWVASYWATLLQQV
jgi:hypothetical protein